MTERRDGPRVPTRREVREAAAVFHMDLTDEEVRVFRDVIAGSLSAYRRLDELYDPPPPDRSEVTSRPSDDDSLNAWVVRCVVEGETDGPLTNTTVGLKDNVALAGVPMTCGSAVLEGYVPDHDATIVSRLLAAGATITGKTNMDDMAFSGTGEVTATGPVLNPRDPDHLAGGSSGGSAAAVVSGDVDLAIGTDQAGSVRIPAAWCGCVGFKPTYGLVPYTGLVGHGVTFDHVGPLARSVEDCALALDAMAGIDPADPRQPDRLPDETYVDAIGTDPPLSIGVVEEGFGATDGEERVDDAVWTALERFASAGAVELEPVSVPEHRDGLPVWLGIATGEATAHVRDEGVDHFVQGQYDIGFAEAFGDRRRTRADEFPPRLKVRLVTGQFLADRYRGRYHALAQNLRHEVAAAYDEVLDDLDLLAMPTVPHTAIEAPDETDLEGAITRGGPVIRNTAPSDITGHPAVSVPCASVDGLPVGLMLIGGRFEDDRVLAGAAAFERAVAWKGIG